MMSQGRLFTQVTLSEKQLRAGPAADVDHVHIPAEGITMKGLKDSGVSLVNRRDPEIALPFGGYFP